MSSKSRAVTIALALAVGLGIPASIAVSTAPSEESQQMIDQQARELDIQMIEEAENGGLAESLAPEPAEPTPTDIPEVEAVPAETEAVKATSPEVKIEAPEPASEAEAPGSVEEDLTDTRDPEEWEPESAPSNDAESEYELWTWTEQKPEEAYVWERCLVPNLDVNCVWVAHENQYKLAPESFIALSDGSVVPLSEDQALAMVGGAIHPPELYATFTTPCEYEDSWGCVWDASVRGNGEGQSFWRDLDGGGTGISDYEARMSLSGMGYNRIWLD